MKKILRKRILISLSGGLDSATLLGYLKQQGHHVECVSFMYGSKHNKYERRAAIQIAGYYGVYLHTIDITPVMALFKSDLLKSGGEVPEGHYTAENMKSTVVPGRNLIFLSIMAGMAESLKLDCLGVGVHAGDHEIYSDCRPPFIWAASDVIARSSDGAVNSIETPFIACTKGQIVRIGSRLDKPVPFRFTRTCYKDQEKSCGVCGSCNERLEAFEINGLVDPVPYAQGEE
jgi:7-cyano-7-deazaguanine synthase